ncbi:MAG: DUF4198 domain-containing protein [Pseudomonadota bacterium]
MHSVSTALLAKRTISAIALALMALAVPAAAHEYYLIPQNFSPDAGSEVAIEHRLGQRFKGDEMPWISKWNIRSELWTSDTSAKVEGKDGDRPALTVTLPKTELTAVIHQSNIEYLTFQTWEKFRAYVLKEGIAYALQPSLDGSKPKEKLLEAYSRFAKTLITPNGTTQGKDRPTGLKVELVALENPMAIDPKTAMPVQLLYDGKPLAGAMIKVFVGQDTAPAYKILTNTDGQAKIPAAGPGPYLLNAIHITDPQSPGKPVEQAHWESFWASLTFQRR